MPGAAVTMRTHDCETDHLSKLLRIEKYKTKYYQKMYAESMTQSQINGSIWR